METQVNTRMNDEKEQTYVIPVDVGRALRPTTAKLTPKKRRKFLELLTKEWNITKAATQIGTTREAIYQLLERDETFRRAFQTVKDAYLDSLEATSFIVASRPSREGFQDRKLMLQAHRRNIYGDKQQIDVNHQVTIRNVDVEVMRILQQEGVDESQIEEAEFEVLPEKCENMQKKK